MALQGLRSAFNARGGPAAAQDAARTPADPISAGGTDAEVFGCPACGRTIPRGTRRCKGCGQRLVLGVQAGKAMRLLGTGLLAGFVGGAALMIVTAPGRPAAVTGAEATGGAAAGPTALPADVAANGLAALRGTTTLNGRLAAQAESLAAAVDAKKLDTASVVKILRRVSADTRAASAMTGALGAWTDAHAHQAALAAFYETLAAELDNGLAASVGSAGAYRATSKRVLAILRQIPLLDAASRDLAVGLDAELPPVTIPAVLLGD